MKPTSPSRPPRLRLLLALVPLLLPLAGCAGGAGESGSSAAGEAADPAGPAQPELAGDASATSRSGVTDGGAGRVPALQRAVVSTGEVVLRSDDVTRARAEVLRLVTGWGGSVADEQTTSDEDGRTTYAALTLRVPSTRFDAAMEALGGVATLVDRSRTSEDVTTQVVDVSARVRAQQQSVRRIEALLTEAGSLRDVITIEGDLSRRQAELDSLRSQQAYLDDQTALSTITVVVDSPVADEPADEPGGFVGGLRDGWAALGGSLALLLTALGAALPFAVVVGALLVPAVAVRRRRSRPTPAPTVEAG